MEDLLLQIQGNLENPSSIPSIFSPLAVETLTTLISVGMNHVEEVHDPFWPLPALKEVIYKNGLNRPQILYGHQLFQYPELVQTVGPVLERAVRRTRLRVSPTDRKLSPDQSDEMTAYLRPVLDEMLRSYLADQEVDPTPLQEA